MKKMVLVLIAVLLFSCSIVSAQETETVTEMPSLTFHTVGDFFSWGDSGEDVYNFLTNYEDAGLEITVEEDETYGKTISGEFTSEEETGIYVFYFDDETEGLWEVECVSVLAEGVDVGEVLTGLIDTYGLTDADAYENDTLQELADSYDAGAVVAGDSTIAVIAGSDETEESYAMVALYFFDRAYFEANF